MWTVIENFGILNRSKIFVASGDFRKGEDMEKMFPDFSSLCVLSYNEVGKPSVSEGPHVAPQNEPREAYVFRIDQKEIWRYGLLKALTYHHTHVVLYVGAHVGVGLEAALAIGLQKCTIMFCNCASSSDLPREALRLIGKGGRGRLSFDLVECGGSESTGRFLREFLEDGYCFHVSYDLGEEHALRRATYEETTRRFKYRD